MDAHSASGHSTGPEAQRREHFKQGQRRLEQRMRLELTLSLASPCPKAALGSARALHFQSFKGEL